MRKHCYYCSDTNRRPPQGRAATSTTTNRVHHHHAPEEPGMPPRLLVRRAARVLALVVLLVAFVAHEPSINCRSERPGLSVLAFLTAPTRHGSSGGNRHVTTTDPPWISKLGELPSSFRPQEEEESIRLVQQERRRSMLFRTLSVGAAAVLSLKLPAAMSPKYSIAAMPYEDDDNGSTTTSKNDDISNVLRPATDDRPPIPLPSGSTSASLSSSSSRRVIAEGLVYYGDPRAARPYATDTLILAVGYYQDPTTSLTSAGSDSNNWVLLAGAKLPLNQVRLPLRFQLTTANLLPNDATMSRATMNQLLSENDLIVQAILCPEEIVVQNPSSGRALVEACMRQQSTTTNTNKVLQASGMAKLLRLPSLDEPIRAPVSLPLEWR